MGMGKESDLENVVVLPLQLLCPTLCNSMDYSRPGSFVLHYLLSLLKFMPTESVDSSSVTVFSFYLQWLFSWGGQCIGASASVLPMNIQGWFSLGLTSLISLQSKGLSRVFSSTTIQKHQVFGAQSSLGSNSHITTWYLSFFHFFSFPLCFLSFSPLSLLPPLPPPSLLSFLHFPYWFPLALQVFRAELGLQTHRSTFCALEGALQVNKHDWMSVELSKI